MQDTINIKQDKEQKNQKGETLAEFLAHYDARKYQTPSLTVDVCVLTHEVDVLLIKRKNHPNINMWALPGGFVDFDETSYAAAQRELLEETGVDHIDLKPVGFFCEPSRDPRTRVVSQGYVALVAREQLNIAAGDDAQDAALFTVKVSKKGRIELPQPVIMPGKLTRPCTPEGEPLPKSAQCYEIELVHENKEVVIKCRVAVEGETNVLLADGIEQSQSHTGNVEGLSSDHALILLSALQKIDQEKKADKQPNWPVFF